MSISTLREIDYPESDGKPMAETPLHMLVMWNTIQTLIDWYADDLKVPEYFLFDPKGEWIKTKLRGFRLRDGEYEEIEAVDGRLPSKVLGLHLEAVGDELRLWDPKTQKYLLTPDEQLARTRRELG